jgi:hypothetical protein
MKGGRRPLDPSKILQNILTRGYKVLQPTAIKPTRKIEVRQLGLATGMVVAVRRVKRKQIEVTYIP